jgi:hypothetical protein
MRFAFAALVLIHGLIHLLGFAKSFGLAPLPGLTREVSRPAGALWLLAAVLFVMAAVLLAVQSGAWWAAAVPAVIVSQVLIALSWSDAKYGTVANVIIALVLVPTLAELLPSSFSREYARAVDRALARSSATMPLLTDADLAPLPAAVQRYVRRSGAVGKPKVRSLLATFTGTFARGPGEAPIDIVAEQYNFFDEPARYFYIRGHLFGVPFDGLHIYEGPSATMRIRVASLVQVGDAKGPQMNQGETVTLFNDMCFLAPASLIDPHIAWDPVDDRTVRARFSNHGVTIGAELKFNDEGDLVDFVSHDRFSSADGSTYESFPWSTPAGGYAEIGGRRRWTHGSAVWHRPEGEFTYITVALRSLELDVTARR